MKRICFLAFIGFALVISGFFWGRKSSKGSTRSLVSAVIHAAYADSTASTVQIRHYKGNQEYILIQTMNEIPKTEFSAQLFSVSDQGIAIRILKNWSIVGNQLKIEGESNIRFVDEFDAILRSH